MNRFVLKNTFIKVYIYIYIILETQQYKIICITV